MDAPELKDKHAEDCVRRTRPSPPNVFMRDFVLLGVWKDVDQAAECRT